jgi:DNA-binding protein HU-beta
LKPQVLAASLDTIADCVTEGKKVTFLGFGSFEPRARAARVGRNPKTGEALEIKASVTPGFTASKSFKDKVNGRA